MYLAQLRESAGFMLFSAKTSCNRNLVEIDLSKKNSISEYYTT